jgi:hypothetical protein
MRSRHHLFLDAMTEGRALRPGDPTPAMTRLLAAQESFANDIDVLNYALTLEHLEAAFYLLAGDYTLGTDAYGNSIDAWAAVAGEHEAAHVATLTQVITQLGGEPVMAADYDFGVRDAQGFLATAAVLENVGVAAYDGAGQYLADPGLLTAAGSIVAVEARHAAYFNLVTGESPFPAAFETPMTPDEVLAAAGGFILGG